MTPPALQLTGAEDTPLADLAARLQSRPSPPPLAPKAPWNETVQMILHDMEPRELLGRESLADEALGAAVKSGLLLWNDNLAESHALSQNIHNSTGSYWHGIMHRREPDYSNSKHWFRQVGDHAIFPDLRRHALAIFGDPMHPSDYGRLRHDRVEASAKWDQFAFVDWCAEAASNGDRHPDATRLLEAVQAVEIELLMAYSYRGAVGK
jgi:hypothetical protein